MNSSSESALVTQSTSRALTHSLQPVLLFILVIFLAMVSSRSAMAAEPPNAAHPPSRTVSASPALRTSRARNTLRPQADTGWYYAEASRDWYYRLSSTSPSLKTGWHHDVDGFTYYLDPSDGHMLAGAHTIDGIEYSFLPERDRGNYHQDDLGAWFYRANGLAPYGSLLHSRARTDRHATPAASRPADTDRDHGLIDSEDLVTDRITIPPKASPSELTRDDDTDTSTTATPSELPRDDASPATPSELPSPSDDRKHAHTSDPSIHCIATDDWSTIRANRDAYSDCITNHCTALLYLSGPPVSWPLPSTDTTTQDYPLYVSLVDAHDGQLTFAQAYAIPALSAVPMYVGTSLHDAESTPTYRQSNLGGLCDTWLFRTLVGTGTNAPFRFYLEEEDGTYSQHEYNYPGYQIRIPDADESHGAALLPLPSTKKYISRGYPAETPRVERTRYTTYLSDERKTEATLPQLFTKGKMKSSQLWFPSTQELVEYTIMKMETEAADASISRVRQTASGSAIRYTPLDANGDPLLSIYLKSERPLPTLADSWRSDEPYWLRSTPSAYLYDETYMNLGMSDTATRDEYFLQADRAGSIRAAHYDDTAAVRLIFTVK